MKASTFFFIVIIWFLTFSSCKKQSSYNYGSISATINGIAFKGMAVGEGTTSDSGKYLYEFGAIDSSATLNFYLPALTVGTYPFGLMAFSPSIMYYSGSTYYFTISPANAPTAGSIVIDSTTTNSVAGTFSGVLYNPNSATDSVIITNGIFSKCIWSNP